MRRIRLVPLLFACVATAGAHEPTTAPEILSFSGSPLLLELTIPDPDASLRRVSVTGGASLQRFEIPVDNDRTALELQVSPFLGPGAYDLEVEAEFVPPGGDSPQGYLRHEASLFSIGFVDWIWGSSNLRFGNNADYESVIGTYGEILESWVADRFGDRETAEMVVLIDHMYKYFGARSGRCYAFAGSELRYWLWPDQLPSYYDEPYDIRLRSSLNQRALNYLQLDMAFSHFLQGGISFAPPPAPDLDLARETVGEVRAAVELGRPVVVGLMGPDLHHAMLAYGYIENRAGGYTDILVANNWKSEQNENLRSRNAEYVRVFHAMPEDESVAPIDWYYVDGNRNKNVTRLFTVPVPESFDLDHVVLDRLVQSRLDDLSGRGRAIVIVEDATRASVTDGELVTGFAPGLVEELEGATLDKVNRTYLFEIPADLEITLDLADQHGTRILYFYPESGGSEPYGWITRTPPPPESSLVRRQVVLGPQAPVWQEEVASE